MVGTIDAALNSAQLITTFTLNLTTAQIANLAAFDVIYVIGSLNGDGTLGGHPVRCNLILNHYLNSYAPLVNDSCLSHCSCMHLKLLLRESLLNWMPANELREVQHIFELLQ